MIARLSLAVFLAASSAHAAVTGILIDESARPVAGATLRAYATEDSRVFRARVMRGADRTAMATAQSDDGGAFRIDASAPLLEISIAAPGKVTQAVEAADGEDLATIVLHAAPGEIAHLTGGGKPLQNAAVIFGTSVVRSDAAGTIEMPEGGIGAARSHIIHPDYSITDFIVQDESVALTAGATIRGRVVSADGQPVAKATIAIEGWPLAESAADGSFVIAHAPLSWRTLTAYDATRAAMVRHIDAKAYEIRLKPAGTIAGTAAPGARVTVATEADRQYVDYVIADAHGNFSLSPLPASRYILRAVRRGYASANAEVVVAEGARATRVLPAKPLPSVHVRVVGEDRQPLAGAFVWTGFPSAAQNLAITDKNGESTVRQIADFNQRAVYVVKPGFAAGTSGQLTEAKTDVTIVLARGFPLQVHVIDKQRQNVPAANVIAMLGTDNEPGPRQQATCEEPLKRNCRRTDDAGVVRLRATEGPHDVRVQGPSIVAKSVAQVLTAKSSPLTIEVDRGVVISGRVAYSDGTPVAGATVSTRPFTSAGRSDDKGTFTLRNVVAGKVMLVAMTSEQQLQSSPTEVSAPARNVVITIPAPARVEGRVTDKETGQPITDFQVAFAWRDSRGGSFGRPIPFHNDDGSFVLDNLGAGPLRLQVAAEGYAPGSLSDLTTEEGHALRGVQVQLDRGGKVRGRVTSGGNPIEGAHVRFGQSISMGAPGLTDAVTDDKGEYVIDGIGAGERTIDFSKEGFLPKHKSVAVERGKEARLDAELDRGRELRGRVTDKTGRAVAGVRVSAMSTVGSGGFRPAITDAEGNFNLDGLADGRYTITAMKDGYVSARQNDVAVPAQTPLALTLDIGGTISGRVLGLSEVELSAADVMASASVSNSRAKVNPDGTFTLRGLPDGRVSVFAMTHGGAVQRQSGQKVVEVVNGSGPSVDIDFGEGISITGRVTKSGVPFPGGNIEFFGTGIRRGSTISSEGRYQVDGLTPGNYTVTIPTRAGTVFNAKYAVVGDATYDIQIQGATVRGRVVDSASGAPIVDASVWSPSSKESPFPRQTTTDSDGRFIFDSVIDGPLELHASSRQQFAPASQTITVSGGTAPEIELRLDRAQPTSFRVVDAQSGATLDAFISIGDGKKMVANGGPARDEDGAIRVYVAAGQYKAFVNARGYVQQSVDFTTPGPEVRVALSQAGRVTLTAAKPVRVRLVAPGAPRPYYGMAVPTGNTIESIPPGNYTLEVLGEDGKTVVKSMPVAINAGMTTAVNLD
ncbi:MAG: carboxypeptidase-like regulatory domain-containing protein [Acidobacteriota bacterium]|nr:carboxypeptidase-like regulatory domain-containing protein [Acidobacteriota bacterium]